MHLLRFRSGVVRHTENIAYVVDPGLDLVLEEWSGDITRDALAAHWSGLMQDMTALRCRRTLVDFSAATIHLHGQDLVELIDNVLLPALQGRRWITAIVAASAVQYGFGRQYLAFGARFSNTRIFREVDEALAWLATERHGD